MLTAYSDEDSYVVWSSIQTVVNAMGDLMERLEGVHEKFATFVAALVRVAAGKRGHI